MVKTAELQRLRERRLKELEQRREQFREVYHITDKEVEELSRIAPPVPSDEAEDEQ